MASEDAADAALPVGRFSGREVFVQTLRDALSAAAQQGWRELYLSDASFEDWPLHERTVVESLHAWARAGRKFTMLAVRYEAVLKLQPRFVEWRRTWGHLIDCRVCRQNDVLNFPSALWSPGWMMQRHDLERSVFVCETDAVRRVALRQLLDETYRRGAPGFPASTLGL